MLNINKITSEFKAVMQQLYGDRLENVILYGSYARNEQSEDSDIDLLVVLKDDEISNFKEISNITDATYKLNSENEFIISPQPISKNRFLNGKTAYLYFIRKDGIVI
jgi:uncharacterized protein